MYKIISFILLFSYFLFSGYGLQVGAYEKRENIPSDIDFGVNYKILEQGDYFKLVLGPFDTKKQVEIFQNRYGIDGFVIGMSDTKQRDLRDERKNNLFKPQQTNRLKYNPSQDKPQQQSQNTQRDRNSYDSQNNQFQNQNSQQGYQQNQNRNQPSTQKHFAIEILSANDRANIPARIIQRVASLGLNPKFVLDKGLYRLILGPYPTLSIAQNVSSQIENAFGRSVYIVNFAKSKFDFAQSALDFISSNANLDIVSTDENEHIGFLEQQRNTVKQKYSNNPFKEKNFVERDPKVKKQSGLSPYVDAMEKEQKQSIIKKQFVKQPMQQGKNKVDSLGWFFGITTSGSKNELIVNGVTLGGSFVYGLNMGVLLNKNTIIGLNYFNPEIKNNQIFISDEQTATVKSTYEYMLSSFIKYRYFIPSNKNLFMSSKFGLGITKQTVSTFIPVNFGTTYNYSALYTEGILGFGVGYFFTDISSLELSYDTYINTKTITSSVRINLNLSF